MSVLTIGLLVALVYRADVSALWDALSNVSLRTITAGLFLVQIQIVVSALRWRFTASRLGQDMSPLKAISEYYVASFLNQTLPGGVAGDIIRAFRMRGREGSSLKHAAKSVAFERLSGQMALFVVALAGLCIWPLVAEVSPTILAGLYLALGAVAIIVIAAVMWRRSGLRYGGLRTLSNDMSKAFIRDGAWLMQSSTSLIVLSSYIGVFYISANATGSQLPGIAVVTVIPFCLAAMLVPTGFGGWGTREAAAMALWPLIGAASADGLAASITYGWLSLAGAAPGAIILAVDALLRNSSSASQKAEGVDSERVDE